MIELNQMPRHSREDGNPARENTRKTAKFFVLPGFAWILNCLDFRLCGKNGRVLV